MNNLDPTSSQCARHVDTSACFDLARYPPMHRRPLTAAWLGLAMAALLASGLFSILLVLSARHSCNHSSGGGFFRGTRGARGPSVLVWFLAFGGALWSMTAACKVCASRGSLRVLAAGYRRDDLVCFVEHATPIMANYIPVLDGLLFIQGPAGIWRGMVLLLLCSMATVRPIGVAPMATVRCALV